MLAIVAVPTLLLVDVGEAAADNSGTTSPQAALNSVLAIASPLAAPACSASGSASLLVPILSGVLQSDLHLPPNLTIGNLLLSAAGPVYVVCGDLPSSPNTQCQLDSYIAAIWPKPLATEGLSSPNPVGDVVNSLSAALAALDLPPAAALEAPLKCSVVALTSTAPAAPPAAAAPPSSGPASSPLPTTTLPLPLTTLPPSSGTGLTGGGLALPQQGGSAASSTSTQAAAPSVSGHAGSGIGATLSSLGESVPGGIVALQFALAMLLALFVVGAWITSGRITWLNSRRTRRSSTGNPVST